MSAVIRVKRCCDEEPLEALVVNCKKRKIESTVLKFAGTLENQEDDILKHIKTNRKTEYKENYKKHFLNVRDKLRERAQVASKSSRYKVVNLCRSNIEPSASGSANREETLTILDVETNEENVENSLGYVFDLYYTNSDDLGEISENEFVSIHALSDELVYGSYQDNGIDQSDSDNSEDSNEENNWRNDYPDEEDAASINDEDMIDAVKKVNINEQEDLSSDDGEEGFVYSIDSEAAGFEEDIDESDVNRYGERYARFKARYKQEKSEDSSYYDEDQEEEDDLAYYD